MVSYTDRAEEGRGTGRARVLALVVVALLVGLVGGRATVPGDEGKSPDGTPPPTTSSPQSLAGQSHNDNGAAAAAANLSAALAYAIARGPDEVQRIATRVGTEGYAARVSAAYPPGSASDQSAAVFFRAVPISYRVLAYSPEQAAVRIWSASILATADASPGAASFKTATVIVRWSGGTWKVDDVREPVEGPTPATTAPSRGTDFTRQLAGTEVLHVQP